ncbi:MAG: hypothetical protein M1830_000219 [Pleopsidium flavum]|nr:MAG: hypothetical protein M1830_000219 [Pleopsidium flavum]
MSGFTVPFSSSTPSTPDSRSRNSSHGNPFGNITTNPTTTPAGPPPSSAGSFTPAGPPPLSMLGSSGLGSSNKPFSSKPSFGLNMGSQRNPNSPSFKTIHPSRYRSSTRTRIGTPGRPSKSRQSFRVPTSSSPPEPPSDIEDEEDSGTDGETEQDDEEMDVDSQADNVAEDKGIATPSQFGSTGGWDLYLKYGSSVKSTIPRGTKRSRAGGAVVQSFGSSYPAGMELVKKKDSAIPGILRDLAARDEAVVVDESDELILATENLMSQLYAQLSGLPHEEQDVTLKTPLSTVPEELIKLWRSSSEADERQSGTDEYVVGIGPNEAATSTSKASFLSTLLVQLHHPPATKGKQAFASSRSGRSSKFSDSFHNSQIPRRPSALPKVLLDWLNAHHNPYPTATIDLQTYQPNPTAHLNFWDIVFSSILRGRISDVIRLLKEADFRHARTAVDDGQAQDGYRGVQLGNITRVVSRAIQVSELCPALQNDNWDVAGTDWMIFRHKIEQAVADLATFAEGRDRDMDKDDKPFQAENFGIPGRQSSVTSLSQSTRRAESKVPWTIYQNLKAMYGILLGGGTEIISFAQDWVEATVGLTAWWDGDDNDEIAVGSLAMTRRSLRRSQSQAPRSVDVNASAAYLRRLSYAFDRVTDDTDEDAFQINSMNPIEVGLASIFEGNVEGLIGLLRGWSLTVTSAVVEIASLGGWLGIPSGTKMRNNFNESDLMVLSYGQDTKVMDKDDILMEYAEGLSKREVIYSEKYDTEREGWELAVEILGRLDDETLSSKKIGELLDRLPLDSGERVDKLLSICSELGLDSQARKISEKYADSIAESSNDYGTALLYYARAHSEKKIKDVLDLLISLCLVQSFAYPPDSDLDEDLKTLITTPKPTLTALSQIDLEAAELLQIYLSGYATLRRFYDLRDEEVRLKEGQKPSHRPIARKKAAAAALIAVITSAEDNIHGGLYDPDRGAVIQVDGLLALLGEALPFIDQPKRILTLPQVFALLKAIEDLQTVTSRVYAQCEECFQSTIANAHGSQVLSTSPRAVMKKSLSNMTASSGFSLIGSEMLASAGEVDERTGRSMGSSGVLVKGEVKRGWDWRNGLGRGVKGEDVLRVLRVGLAKEVARGWLDGDEA